MQEIEIEENIRYLMFDEKEMKEKYEKIHGKKSEGSSVTDVPTIYNIESNIFNDNQIQIRLIDTAGFGDTRGKQYDDKIINDIQTLFENSDINNINAICIIFKASLTRAHDRLKYMLDKLFSIFGEDIKNNIIIIFTFADSFDDSIPAINALKDENLPFIKILGNIESIPHYFFNKKKKIEQN